MPNGIKRETFERYDTDSKLNTLFDYIHDIYEKSCTEDIAMGVKLGDQVKKCEKKYASKDDVTWLTWAVRVLYAVPILALFGYILDRIFT